MSKPFVLVTAPTVSEQAQKILREGGADVGFHPIPISEQDLLSAFSRQKIHAVLLQNFVNPEVFKNVQGMSK